jgi:hypothetical protein
LLAYFRKLQSSIDSSADPTDANEDVKIKFPISTSTNRRNSSGGSSDDDEGDIFLEEDDPGEDQFEEAYDGEARIRL